MSGVLLDATGRRLLQSGGKVVLDDGAGNDCCCGTTPSGCRCEQGGPFSGNFYDLPTEITVTATGITMPTGGCITCTGAGGVESYHSATGSAPSGTWTVPLQNCLGSGTIDAQYGMVFASPFTITTYSDSSCTTVAETMSNLGVSFSLGSYGDLIRLAIGPTSAAVGTNYSGPGYRLRVFLAWSLGTCDGNPMPITAQCQGTYNYSNIYTAAGCNCSSGQAFYGYGGSATVTV